MNITSPECPIDEDKRGMAAQEADFSPQLDIPFPTELIGQLIFLADAPTIYFLSFEEWHWSNSHRSGLCLQAIYERSQL